MIRFQSVTRYGSHLTVRLWMMTIEHIKPTTALIPFNTYFCDVELRKNKTNKSNRFYEGIRIHIYEEKTIQKPRKEDDIFRPEEVQIRLLVEPYDELE